MAPQVQTLTLAVLGPACRAWCFRRGILLHPFTDSEPAPGPLSLLLPETPLFLQKP